MKQKRRCKHGLCGTPEYKAYIAMKQRCYNPKNHKYSSYGGRGIKVCDRWLESITYFIEDIGLRPSPLHSLERINNDLGYSPDNCKWALPSEQMNNTRWNNKYKLMGMELSVSQWSKLAKVNPKTFRNRLYAGWSLLDALKVGVQRTQEINEKGQFVKYYKRGSCELATTIKTGEDTLQIKGKLNS